ncbi:thioesterase [Alkalilimnicola ehrlichii]|uniref:Thioesterase n=1 Tax=Alkalilimnicola ehrlichii TaxID=351052 RepID=A0A3E0WJS5_9GAMM|nr:acyl-CoA thioesterase [Alkalilimnicola ehrlichii]RFA26157.1 thioesterase [Alkalilimnicola ehrlichii]RFA32347.1 thioesterase [Alkalilimnicola ehrlichii]
MNLYFRLLLVLIKTLFRPRLAPMESSVLRFRVWPNDLDMNMHMNNGRYLTLMDLGRTDLMLRNGLAKAIVKQRWMAVIASVMIRYRRSLLPFQPFELHTRMLCWDDKWFFMEQRIVRNGRTVTIALVKGVVRRSGGYVAPAEFLEKGFGKAVESPEMPESVLAWLRSEEHVTAD